MAKTKAERLQEVHTRALLEFNRIQDVVHAERAQCLQDRRFYSIAGAQWEGVVGQQFENKPKLEVNKIHLAVIRIINEYRNNRITVNFSSKTGLDDTLADTCDGLYRANEQDSGAEEAYDNAFEEAVAGGFGAWRLRSVYEDESDPESDAQHISIEPIFDADTSVFFDLQAKRQDKKDAKRCYVLTSMDRDAYVEEYNDDPATWPQDISSGAFDWHTPDVVYVAEYYEVETKKEFVHIWQLLDGSEIRLSAEEAEEREPELLATGAQEVRVKKVLRDRVRKYIMSGGKVLEDCGYIAGPNIPIVPCYGKRWYVENVERCMGHVRLSKDVQRLKNMQLSKLAEISALGSVEKPIVTPEQIAGHQGMWAEDNIKNYPYLLINPVTDQDGNEVPAAPVAYTRPAQIPPALAALLQATEMDMMDLLGNAKDGEKIEGNISTETATLIQNRLDMQTFIYMSNMAKAIKRSGEIWLGMAREVYVEEGRVLKSLGSQDELEKVELMRPTLDEDGALAYENDLSKALFDVATNVGPSSSTKRAATIRSLTQMMSASADPETVQVLGAMIIMNMEGEGLREVKQYFRRKLIRMGVVEPTEQEAQELAQEAQNAKPSAQDQYLEASAEAERARGMKAQADTVYTQAQADKARAQTAEILADIDLKEQEKTLEIIDRMGPRVEPMLQ